MLIPGMKTLGFGGVFMSYCMYLRKSRADLEAEARGEGETLARHRAALLEVARQQQLNITEIYSEIVSGETISARPVMQKLLSHIEQGIWEGVLVMDVDRLARGDTIDQGTVLQALKCSGTKVITPLKSYDPNNEYDEEYFEFGLFLSRREYKTIVRRMQRGREASIREGKYVGNKPPYGYQRKKIAGAKGYTLEPDPAQADAVKLIFEWYTKGAVLPDGSRERLGFSRIAKKLDSLHLPTASGKAWSAATIKEILTNPIYIGKVRWNRRPQVKHVADGVVFRERPRSPDYLMVDGLHPPLIDLETYQQAQNQFKLRLDSQTPKGKRIQNPLAKILVCGMCGRVMVRRPYMARNYPDTLLCPNRQCTNVSSQLSVVEERLLSLLDQWLTRYKIEIQNESEDAGDRELQIKKQAVAQLQSDLEKLRTQQNKLYDLLEQGVYSTEIFLERSQRLTENIASSQAELEKMQDEIRNHEALRVQSQVFIPQVEKILEVYCLAENPKEKNDLLKQVLTKVVYKKTANGHYKGQQADDFDLILFPKLPTA